MTKLEETMLLVQSINKAREDQKIFTFPDNIEEASILLDIAKSLAIIADKLTEIPAGSRNYERMMHGFKPVEGLHKENEN